MRQANRKTKIRFLIGLGIFILFLIYQMTRKRPLPFRRCSPNAEQLYVIGGADPKPSVEGKSS